MVASKVLLESSHKQGAMVAALHCLIARSLLRSETLRLAVVADGNCLVFPLVVSLCVRVCYIFILYCQNYWCSQGGQQFVIKCHNKINLFLKRHQSIYKPDSLPGWKY